MISNVVWVLFLPIVSLQLVEEEVDHNHIRCLVCKETVNHIERAVNKVSPQLKMQKGFRIDGSANQNDKGIEYRKSELFLTEVLEEICKKMEDYVKAKVKGTGEIILLSLLGESSGMNPAISDVDFLQDADLNRSLKIYCEEILENHDEIFISQFQSKEEKASEKICTMTNICPVAEQAEDYEKDEL